MNIQRLVDEVLALASSQENQRRIARRQALVARETTHYSPSLYVRLNRPYVSSRINVNLKDLIHDTETYLYLDLMTKILNFTECDDDTPLCPDVMLQLGVAWELTLHGIPWVEVDGEEPWVGQPVLSRPDDVDRLEVPQDFSQVGMMPLTLRIYTVARHILGDRIRVHFPDWLAGPTRVVQKLRGEENFFLDVYDNPAGVHKMYEYATRVRRSYEAWRTKLTGTGPGPAEMYYWEFKTLANDEVNAQLLSPGHYREFVYPYDLEYCRDYGRVYFHGSGVFTPYLEIIKTLPNVALIEISDWSDMGKASQVLGDGVILERSFLQTEKALTGEAEVRRRILNRLVEEAGGSFFYFILNVDNRDEGIEQRAREWVRVSREVIADRFPRQPSFVQAPRPVKEVVKQGGRGAQPVEQTTT
jgi:hypothetical protein